MHLNNMIEALVVQFLQTEIQEVIAVVFAMASVILSSRNNVGLYPAGIISTSLFIWIMADAGLYAESWLNGYYLLMSIYGWWRWQKNREHKNAKAISRNSRKDWIITGLIVVAGGTMLYIILKQYTDSDVPFWDATIAATAWAGMWLLAKHKVENWLLLNISNFIAVPLQFHKGIPLTALLTIFLFIVAVFGYLRWSRQYRQQNLPI